MMLNIHVHFLNFTGMLNYYIQWVAFANISFFLLFVFKLRFLKVFLIIRKNQFFINIDIKSVITFICKTSL